MRTIGNGQYLVELDSHINRLQTSAVGCFGEVTFNEELQRNLTEKFPLFIKHVYSRLVPVQSDVKFMVILDKEPSPSDDFYLLCHTDTIKRPPQSVEVDVAQITRHNPHIKSVEWAMRRQDAEKAKRRCVFLASPIG